MCAGDYSLANVEADIFERFSTVDPSTIFILGAPRTGSTLLFQSIATTLQFPFFSNFINFNYPTMPIIGSLIQRNIVNEVSFSSRYGKTIGNFEPSEASAIMSFWFGGGHPSEILSHDFILDRQQHFLNTLSAVEKINEAPLVIKNAWNCFRISSISACLPSSRFIWVRRDIRRAAISDLRARLITKNDLTMWNSATPKNYFDLINLPPALQVVENQYAFNDSILQAFESVESDRKLVVWYEELIRDFNTIIKKIAYFLKTPVKVNVDPKIGFLASGSSVLVEEEKTILSYVDKNVNRFATHIFDT